ncbi:MAG TPA: hypothetical protein VGI14_04910 [Casimicrobiaceae bacterium]|jgi:hypothetical protein
MSNSPPADTDHDELIRDLREHAETDALLGPLMLRAADVIESLSLRAAPVKDVPQGADRAAIVEECARVCDDYRMSDGSTAIAGIRLAERIRKLASPQGER